jgi:CheY-like chemotaxis protein
LSGEEVLARLRADEATRDVPVIVLTADATKRRLDPLAVGARAYVIKPIAMRRSLEPVDEFLDARQAADRTS